MSLWKMLFVEALSADREKKNLADKIEEKVKKELADVKGVLEDVKIQASIDNGGFGKAIVTIFYKKGGDKDGK